MTVLLVDEKCSCTPSTLRFFASLRLVLEQNCLFLDGHQRVKKFFSLLLLLGEYGSLRHINVGPGKISISNSTQRLSIPGREEYFYPYNYEVSF